MQYLVRHKPMPSMPDIELRLLYDDYSSALAQFNKWANGSETGAHTWLQEGSRITLEARKLARAPVIWRHRKCA
jgi:hypothetical protein